MEYPLISEYREAILSSEENFSELSSLRPVLDSHGDPVMSSGNFAVVFKMTDINDGKHYAVKCFIKDQEGRDESYKKIADELEVISSSYILPLRYLENELFVDSSQCDNDEFPVVVMEWVEGETLDSFMNRNLDNKYELEMLSYRFNRMSAWLLAQPFAHGDLKPDNILVRTDGSLVLVDYDGIFVPSMKGEKAREIGSPNYRHPLRTDSDFNEHIDDFSIAVIALSLRAISLNPQLKSQVADVLLLSDSDFRSPATSVLLDNIRALTSDSELSLLLGIFYIALAKNSLESLSFRLFMTAKPKQPAKPHRRAKTPVEPIDTSCSAEDIANGIADEFGVIYSPEGTRLLQCHSSIETYTIAKTCKVICDSAFPGIQTLQSINIPESVTAIGNCAFGGCQSLQSINIPESVTTIGDGAFGGCQSLQSINIPESVTAIGNWAFSDCESLQSINIPESVTAIGINPFVSCNSLSITLSKHSQLCIVNGLLIHQSGRLIACLNNSSNICIPESVTAIGDGAFSYCKSLQSINIPESVTAIGDGAFSGCSSLKSVNIPESVTAIGARAFSDCESLQSINIPESVTAIGARAFLYCESLQTINIPESVTAIGDNAFSSCSSLKSVNIPESVTAIGDGAFSGCSSLKSVNIPESVTAIGDSAFSGCSSLKSVNIPESVTVIGDGAFSDCSSLKSVNIPESVTVIGRHTFSDCKSLQTINIPESVTAIGDEAFANCDSLQSINIPESVSTIGINPFVSCNSLSITLSKHSQLCIVNGLLIHQSGRLIACLNNSSDICIPELVTTIGDKAFSSSKSIRCVNIPESVTAIGDCAFICCDSLQSINIPESVTAIGDHAFFWCESLQSINIPESVTTIGDEAFSGCKSLQSINIPESVTAIGRYTFSYCESLQTINIPESVTNIGYAAFPGTCKVIRTRE